MPPKSAPAPLPQKEAALFKQLLTQYEAKQLKKAIKTADTILKKCPDSGETVSMKGLVLTYMGKKEEGIELVKKGVSLHLTSSICWHVYGLVHKADKNYLEALKCYGHALKFDQGNLNILRDTATLQAQLRMFDALVETRTTILRLRPNLRQHWVAVAVAHTLNRDFEAARVLLQEYIQMLKEVPSNDPEYSELLLFYINVLEKLEKYDTAIDVLNTYSSAILDRMRVLSTKPRLLTKLGRKDEAKAEYKALLERNPDCYEWYRQYFASDGYDLEHPDTEGLSIVSKLQELSAAFPQALVPRRLLLNISTGEQFVTFATDYIHRGLSRNIPSLFSDLKPLYSDPTKCEAIERIVVSYLEDIETKKGADLSGELTTYIWCLYFLANHHSTIKDYEKANILIDKAIEHTPTLPELYMSKARNLKRAGDLYGAASAMEAARLLDGQDRFINCKAATYRLRAGENAEALTLLGMFTKKDAQSPAHDLEDMQSFKFLLEDGEALLRLGKLPLALKRFRAVDKIFTDVFEDQYDFHTYCLRKSTFNVYLDTIELEDRLRYHPAYVRATVNAVNIYVKLFDDPELAAKQTAQVPATEAEKKAKKKAKKDRAKAAAEAAKKSTDADDAEAPKTDDDPDGHKLLLVADPIEQAAGLLQPLVSWKHDNFDLWLAIYDVAIRRKKYLQALRALQSARRIRAESGDSHYRVIDFHLRVSALQDDVNSTLNSLIKDELAKLLPSDVTPSTYNSTFLQQNGSSAEAILGAARASQRLDCSAKETEDIVFMTLQDGVEATPQLGLKAVQILRELDSERLQEFLDGCQKRFSLSTVFFSEEKQAELKQRHAARHVEEERAHDGEGILVETTTTT